jgi:hypothetical protein
MIESRLRSSGSTPGVAGDHTRSFGNARPGSYTHETALTRRRSAPTAPGGCSRSTSPATSAASRPSSSRCPGRAGRRHRTRRDLPRRHGRPDPGVRRRYCREAVGPQARHPGRRRPGHRPLRQRPLIQPRPPPRSLGSRRETPRTPATRRAGVRAATPATSPDTGTPPSTFAVEREPNTRHASRRRLGVLSVTDISAASRCLQPRHHPRQRGNLPI